MTKLLNDKELLELAAKAAGIEIQWESDGSIQNRMNRPTIPYFCQNMSSAIDWNPLTDDGDAFCLAVKLGIYFHVVTEEGVVSAKIRNGERSCWRELISTYPYAATRRAIVRAADEIGRRMK